MLTAVRTPGAYSQRVDAGGADVTPLRTDVAGFAGIAERGPLDLPVPVTSWRQFVSWFGDVVPDGYLAHAVRGFFENGGARAWVVRVASRDPVAGAAQASVELWTTAGPSTAARPAWRLAASTPGAWGNRLGTGVREVNRVQLTTIESDPAGRWSAVPGVSGLARAVHVRLRQPGRPPVWAVVADVDPIGRRVHWVRPDGGPPPQGSPLRGLDLGEPILLESVEYRVTVTLAGRPVGVHDRLSLVPHSDSYGPRLLPGVRPPIDPVTRAATAVPPALLTVEELRDDPADPHGLDLGRAAPVFTGGRGGLSTLAPHDFVGGAPWVGPPAARGLAALEAVAEVGLLAVPDALVRPEPVHPTEPPPTRVPDPCRDGPAEPVAVFPAPDADAPPVFTDQQVYVIQAAMVEQCERLRYRFALLDPPFAAAGDPAGLQAVLDWRARFDSSYAALSYPWLAVHDPATPRPRLVPPSGHVAGGYAGTDLGSGVHHAPANRPVRWALAAAIDVDDARHGVLNDAGVNAIRAVGNRGLRVLGARTVSSDPDRRFVPVRRLLAMIEKAMEIALQWVVFEPNDVYTRARVTLSVTSFLLELHERGMLAGATPEESFYVACDEDNNPATEREQGRLLVEIGVAPTVPFEFVVVRVGQVRDSLQVRETGGAR